MIISIIYNLIFIPIARIIIFFLKFSNPKLKEREQNWKKSLESLKQLPGKDADRLWFHAASMGEFEQAKPVIEKIKELKPDTIIIVSFFSPSGYNNQKNYKFADAVVYMPFDTRKNVLEFLELVNPSSAIFIRYEIWYNYLCKLKENKIPAFLICATEPRKSKFLKPFYKACFSFFYEIFTVDEKHTIYFKYLNITSEIHTSSDTRFDRIIQNVESAKENPIIPESYISKEEFVLVCGSTWQPDENIIISAIKNLEAEGFPIRLILVPHEPDEHNIGRLMKELPDSILLSEILTVETTGKYDTNGFPKQVFGKEKQNQLKLNQVQHDKHIIVDSIGKLLRLYSHAGAAYIGGAFGVGVHSVTEPAGYGIPLASGPKMKNSPDAIRLNELGALRIINNQENMFLWLKELIQSKELSRNIGNMARNYVYGLRGASEIIAKRILNVLSRL
jgi:3-deoxy-D-manno-octulosonic-acid transferase